jgi:hypothetical protein
VVEVAYNHWMKELLSGLKKDKTIKAADDNQSFQSKNEVTQSFISQYGYAVRNLGLAALGFGTLYCFIKFLKIQR